MSQYNTGTVAVTNGSAVVTGTATLFAATITAGDFFTVVADNVFYTVASVDSDTQLTLSANYGGVTASGKAYTLVRDFTTTFGWPVPNQGDIETALVVKRSLEEIDSELTTAGLGGDGREWVDLKDTPTFVNATQFTVATDRSANYHVNRRIRATDSATIYGRISATGFAAGVTTVTVVWDSGSLTAALSAVSLGIASATTPAITGDGVSGGTPAVDTIAEYTAAAGVTVDGVLHKDGVVSTGTPTSAAHAAPKSYVDALVVSGVFWKQPVRVATTANITLSGEQTIDGVLTSADRVLVKDQTSGSENGIYVSAAAAWSRSLDADADAEVVGGIALAVSEGTANGDKSFTLTTDDPIVVGTTALSFAQFSGGGGVTGVTASAPVTSSGGSTPVIGITGATTGAAGSMSAADKTKLDGVESTATADQTNGEIKTAYEANANTNEFSDAEQTKLAGIESAATADQTNGEIKTAYEANADTNEFSDAEQTKLAGIATAAEVNPAVVSQADAEAGTATTEQIWTAQRVSQAIAALASGADAVARNNIMLNAFRIAINGGLSVLNMEDGMVDEFEDQSGVDTAASTGATYDAVNDLYFNQGTSLEGTWLQANVSWGNNGGAVAGQQHGGFKFRSSLSGTISQIRIDLATVTAAYNAHLELWSDSAGSPGSQVGVDGDTLSLSSTGVKTLVFGTPPSVTTATDYWIVIVGESATVGNVGIRTVANQGGTIGSGQSDTITSIADDQLFNNDDYKVEVTVVGGSDLALSSAAFTALAAPVTTRIVVFEEDVDAVTLNTDLKASATRDAGRTFTTDFATDDKLDLTAHGFVNTDRVTVISTATLPAGLAVAVLYYVVNKTTNDFELSLTSGGLAVAIADNGTGTHKVIKWAAITLIDEGDYTTGQQILAGSVDISGQPTGTAMKWRVETFNDKSLKIHGVALQWS